jgi:hypothetical protein
VYPVVQFLELVLKVCLVVRPSRPIHSGGRVLFEGVKRQTQQFGVDVMEKRDEPFLLVMPCGLPYALQRLGHTYPVLRPERALLARIPLGPCPSLHQLRRGLGRIVRWRVPVNATVIRPDRYYFRV